MRLTFTRPFACFALAVALALAAPLTGCSGNTGSGSGSSLGDPSSASSDTGTWTGTWLSHSGVGGALTFDVSDGDGALTGSVTFTDSPCFASGAFSGMLSGGHLSGTVTSGGIEVTIDATIVDAQMSGSYVTVSAGACTGDTGTFSASE